jgi:peptidoglycan/xylan/chitin deacetylase (PgdA/CDA1 family)
MPDLPDLPFLLWRTPPGLELALGQEGVPFEVLESLHPGRVRRARFVLFDGQQPEARAILRVLTREQAAIDISGLREGLTRDPFEELVDHRDGPHRWEWNGLRLEERIARVDRRRVRERLVRRLRDRVHKVGGVWARLAPYPAPYRSAFNFRVDLDEPYPGDYFAFAEQRKPVEDCTTHFLSTAAYGADRRVLDDLRGRDVQSHGHFHVVPRDPLANRRNLLRAHQILADAGLEPTGFAAPEGRWNAGLDEVLEELGYRYSSDFSIGRDDFPFHPWRGGRFSKVLQVPVHPVCEGLFLLAGQEDGEAIGDYYGEAVRRRLSAGEPAFVYGHPERRLGRMPEILERVAREVERFDLVWRVTLTEFAAWWDYKLSRRWRVYRDSEGRLEVDLDGWDRRYPLTLEIFRGEHAARVPLRGPRTIVPGSGLAFEKLRLRVDGPEPTPFRPPFSVRSALRKALDWDTVTPLNEMHADSLMGHVRKGLRAIRDHRPRGANQ